MLTGRPSIVIAHRLSTIRQAGRIVVLEHGRIAEQGTHDELIDAEGRYFELCRDWAEQAAAWAPGAVENSATGPGPDRPGPTCEPPLLRRREV